MNIKITKLSALLIAGAIIISGCGASDTSPVSDTQTAQEAAEIPGANTPNAQPAAEVPSEEVPAAEVPTQNEVGTDTNSSVVPAPVPESQDTVPDSGEIHNLVGIITDATKYSVAVQSTEGNTFYLTIPESGVEGNLDYLTIGQIATISYTGTLDENHATLVGLSDSSMITGIYVEEYAFAIKIMNAVKNMDKNALMELTNIPLFMDTGDYHGLIGEMDTIRNMNNERIFTEALVERMANYNLFSLEYTDAGFVMGNGGPNITFDVDDDGILGIIGINCTDTAR